MKDYESRKKIIGDRIKKEREHKGLSKKELLPKIFMSESSYKTLTAWEKGERIPDLTSLVRMASVFQCDVGYLLGDYATRQHENADTSADTGLTEQAVIGLRNIKRRSPGILKFLSFLIERGYLYAIGKNVLRCIDLKQKALLYKNTLLPALKLSDEEIKLKFSNFIVPPDENTEQKLEEIYNKEEFISDAFERYEKTIDEAETRYIAGLWYCTQNSTAAIQDYIREESLANGKHSRTPR